MAVVIGKVHLALARNSQKGAKLLLGAATSPAVIAAMAVVVGHLKMLASTR